jgi:hypothetical protein
MIRARQRVDLENLAQHGITGDILEIPHADYRYRVSVSRKDWAGYLSTYATDMRYSNFKNTLPHDDHDRHDAYFRCWSVMNNWQK